jgi:hypothetical protein
MLSLSWQVIHHILPFVIPPKMQNNNDRRQLPPGAVQQWVQAASIVLHELIDASLGAVAQRLDPVPPQAQQQPYQHLTGTPPVPVHLPVQSPVLSPAPTSTQPRQTSSLEDSTTADAAVGLLNLNAPQAIGSPGEGDVPLHLQPLPLAPFPPTNEYPNGDCKFQVAAQDMEGMRPYTGWTFFQYSTSGQRKMSRYYYCGGVFKCTSCQFVAKALKPRPLSKFAPSQAPPNIVSAHFTQLTSLAMGCNVQCTMAVEGIGNGVSAVTHKGTHDHPKPPKTTVSPSSTGNTEKCTCCQPKCWTSTAELWCWYSATNDASGPCIYQH